MDSTPLVFPKRQEELFRRVLFMFHIDYDRLKGNAGSPEIRAVVENLGQAVESACSLRQWSFLRKTINIDEAGGSMEQEKRDGLPDVWLSLPSDFNTLYMVDGELNRSYRIEGKYIAFKKKPKNITYITKRVDWELFPYPETFLSLIADCLAQEVSSYLDPEGRFMSAIQNSLSLHISILTQMSFADSNKRVPPQGFFAFGRHDANGDVPIEDDLHGRDDYGYSE